MKVPRIDPVISVIAFVIIGTLVIWGVIQMAGPGRPSDAVVLLSVAAPVVIAVGFGWVLARSSPD